MGSAVEHGDEVGEAGALTVDGVDRKPGPDSDIAIESDHVFEHLGHCPMIGVGDDVGVLAGVGDIHRRWYRSQRAGSANRIVGLRTASTWVAVVAGGDGPVDLVSASTRADAAVVKAPSENDSSRSTRELFEGAVGTATVVRLSSARVTRQLACGWNSTCCILHCLRSSRVWMPVSPMPATSTLVGRSRAESAKWRSGPNEARRRSPDN